MQNNYEIELSDFEIERLQAVLDGIFCERIKNRAEILLRINDGDSYRNISKMLGVSQNTITNTLKRYLSGGVGFIIKARNDLQK